MRTRLSRSEMLADDAETLTISPEKVCFIVVKAREFDAKDQVTEPDPGSNPSDDGNTAILEDHDDDPVVEELTSFINCLSEYEQIDLVALTWLGRDDYSASDWPAVRAGQPVLTIDGLPAIFSARRSWQTSSRRAFHSLVAPAKSSKLITSHETGVYRCLGSSPETIA